MAVTVNRGIVLAQRPTGIPGPAHFRREDRPLAPLQDGQFLVRNLFLSVDPAQRGWVNAAANYADPVPIGGVMRALAVGIVAASRNEHVSVGEHLYGWFGWQDYCVATEQQLLARVHPAHGPISAGLGVFGITGISAYLALTELGKPQAGETVLVSTAAGAVGSIVGQIARRLGCRAVGLTGADHKVAQCIGEFGYHGALNYRSGLERERLQALCPTGVDIFFDNTAGAIADAVWPLLNQRGRIVQCGTAAIAAWDPPPTGPRHERDVLTKRLCHQGFIVFDHRERFEAVIAQLAAWSQAGALVYREDIEDGLERAPAALAQLYRGENRGKKSIRIFDGVKAL
jgi:NADPH-dependent curcumin reductase CurA